METESKKRFGAFSISNFIMSFYLFFMLGVFPLYYRYQYYKMGDWKYRVFQYLTLPCIGILFVFLSVVFLWRLINGRVKETMTRVFGKNSFPDKMVLLYFMMTTISYLLTDFKYKGFYGSSGWYMGYLAQIMFVVVYFLVSRAWEFHYEYLIFFLVVSASVFVIGLLHRFDIDALWIYGDLELKYKIQFLSTMGQSSWYAGFLCVVFPIGLYLFFVADTMWVRLTSGLFSVISMLALVSQNTDSAFLSLAAVLMLLCYLAFDNKKQMYRFLEVLLLVFGSFMFMGYLQKIFAKQMIPLDALSVFMSQGWLSPFLFGLLLVVYGGSRFADAEKMQKNSKDSVNILMESVDTKRLSSRIYRLILTAVAIGVLIVILFIILNSNGFLNTHFGYQNVNNYLLFNDNWGNQRGFAWRFTSEAYKELPLLRKWFGVGPDCYADYNNSIPKLAEQVKAFWGNLSLTNAHNEYLNKLYNLGILGLFSYVGMLVSMVYFYVKKRTEHILLPAFALCVVSYMAYLIFCYEQVCCTPFFYILMGVGSNLIYNNRKRSTY